MASPKNSEYQPTTIYEDVLATPDRKKPHKVCNTWPNEMVIPHLSRHYTVPGKPDDARFGVLEVNPIPSTMDLGECRTLSLLNITAKTLAKDLIGLCEASKDPMTGKLAPAIKTSQLFEKGFFVPEGDEPTEEEVAAAEKRRYNYMIGQIKSGDQKWGSTNGDITKIPGDAIVSARFLKMERPWAALLESSSIVEAFGVSVPCPIIGSHNINRGDRKCVVCNEWISWDEQGAPYASNDPERKRSLVAEKTDTRRAAPTAGGL